MGFILEVIFSCFGELIIQILLEFPFEWLMLEKKDRKKKFLFLLCMVFGVIAGILSLFIFKEHLISNLIIRVLNLVLGPIVIGQLFVKLHEKRKHKEEKDYLFSSFWNAYVFALSIALVRFLYIH